MEIKRSYLAISALVAAMCLISTARVAPDDTAFFGGDTQEYQSMAVNLASGAGLRFGGVLPFEAYKFDVAPAEQGAHYDEFMNAGRSGGVTNFYRAPVYPVFLAALYRVFGVSPRLAKWVQISLLAMIAAALPWVTRAVFGGYLAFLAGIVGGLFFFKLHAEMADAILTEALIALTVFLVVAAWLQFARNPGSVRWAGAFGLSLAFALLTKGSTIFLAPLFGLYILIAAVRKTTLFPARAVLVAAVAFAVPVAGYSVLPSMASGRFVFVTTQGNQVLLDGNNERSVRSGGWEPGWANDPASFYNATMRPGEPASWAVMRFYLHDPLAFPLAAARKISAGFGWVPLAHASTIALCLLAASCIVAGLALSSPAKWLALSGAMTLGLWYGLEWSSYLPLFAALVLLTLGGLLLPSFRQKAMAMWQPGIAGFLIIVLNFLLITVLLFGDPRFLAPMAWVIYSSAAYAILLVVRATLEVATPSRDPGLEGA